LADSGGAHEVLGSGWQHGLSGRWHAVRRIVRLCQADHKLSRHLTKLDRQCVDIATCPRRPLCPVGIDEFRITVWANVNSVSGPERIAGPNLMGTQDAGRRTADLFS
jgi:hypothetical protein